MRKIYTVRIEKSGWPGVWYGNKLGKTYEVEMALKTYYEWNPYDSVVTFLVIGSMIHYIYPQDCIVLSERIEYDYSPNDNELERRKHIRDVLKMA